MTEMMISLPPSPECPEPLRLALEQLLRSATTLMDSRMSAADASSGNRS
jgi:hypothetical protein